MPILIYVCSFILSVCSLLYELLIAQAVSVYVASAVMWYSITIGFFLLSFGAGALLYHRIYGEKNPLKALFEVELSLSIVGASSVALISLLHIFYVFLWEWSFSFSTDYQFFIINLGKTIFFVSFFIVTSAVGLLSGFELPVLIDIAKSNKGVQASVNRILAVDYFGALVAGVVFPLALLVYFELFTIAMMVALLNLVVAAYVVMLLKKQGEKIFVKSAVLFCIIIMIAGCLFYTKDIQQFFLKKYYYFHTLKNVEDIYSTTKDISDIRRVSSSYQKIDIVEDYDYRNPLTEVLVDAYSAKRKLYPDVPHGGYLYLNLDFQFNSDIEEFYHEYFVHIPMIINETKPHRVLVLGGGDGLAIRELLKYDDIEEITIVELDERMLDLSLTDEFFTSLNRGSLENARVEIIVADAFQFMRQNKKKFDAVFIDFPDVTDYNTSKLYSVEFFTFVKRALNPDGFAAFDATGITRYFDDGFNGIRAAYGNPWYIYVSTLLAAEFQTIVPFQINLEIDNKPLNDKLKKDIKTLVSQDNDVKIKEAYQFFEKKAGDDYVVEKLVESYQKQLKQGFFFVKPDREGIRLEFVDPNVELLVLNKKRFDLALYYPFAVFNKPIDELINSIMRPTLPARSMLEYIKLPF